MNILPSILLILLSPIAIANSASSNISKKSVMELFSTEKSSSYVKQMSESMPTGKQSQTLQSYLNSLLKVNAIYDKENPGTYPMVFYKIQFNNEGKLLVTRNELDEKGRQIDIRSLSVYGISYELEYDCSWQEQLCWVIYPGKTKASAQQNERWLEISYAPDAISELVNGMGLLIKELQR